MTIFHQLHDSFQPALFAALFSCLTCLPAAAESAAKHMFDIPAGDARPMLRQFAAQAKTEILFPVESVEGIKTNAVKGEMTAQQAIEGMLAATGLSAARDTKTEAIAIRRNAGPPPKNGVARVDSTPAARAETNKANAADEKAIELTPFTVTADKDAGYQATNTLDGSRLNTPLRDTPGAISVFTKDFLDDIGATNLESILRYDVNAEIVDDNSDNRGTGQGAGSGSIENGIEWRTRGLGASTSTNGFRAAGADTDTYNIERVGSNRGPNAILFGSGAAGGVLNFRTKTANVSHNVHTAEFRVGSHDEHRTSLDVNRVLIEKKLAVRVMGLLSHTEDQRPHVYTNKKGVTLAAQYRFSDDTNVNVSFDRQLTAGIGSQAWGPLDQVSLFLDGLKAGQVVWNQARERYETRDGNVVGAASGVGNKASRTVVVYGPDGPNVPAVLWEGITIAANRTTLATNATRYAGETFTVADEGIVPYNRVSAQGGATYTAAATSNFTATFNHRWFDHLYMELAYNRATRRSDAAMNNAAQPLQADLNYRLPDGALNPYFYGNGYYFIGPEQGFRHLRANDNDTIRAAFSYDIDLGKRWGHHRFAAMGERYENRVLQFRAREQWAGAPYGGLPEANQNHVYRRRYFKIDGPWENYTQGYGHDPYYLKDTYQSVRGAGTLS
ncbi:MAG: TonB-dependent receptor plug domain-containing protein, partial [Verrucomicrobia bacterium]|nr:TonB-dependent receptor plug domain-containing protein [Verrucomicrobiota bacterium]